LGEAGWFVVGIKLPLKVLSPRCAGHGQFGLNCVCISARLNILPDDLAMIARHMFCLRPSRRQSGTLGPSTLTKVKGCKHG
jgi:hypothetical protein